MLAVLALVAAQANALGRDPAVWISDQYGIRLLVPRSWQQTSRRELKEQQKKIETDRFKNIESNRKNLIPTDLPEQSILFQANDRTRFASSVEILAYKTPPKWLVTYMPQWPKSGYSSEPPLHELPRTPSLYAPIEISGIRGYVSFTGGEWSSAGVVHAGNSLIFDFKTPTGDYIEFVGSTLEILSGDEAAKYEDETMHRGLGKKMQEALPVFDAIIRSIAFTKNSH